MAKIGIVHTTEYTYRNPVGLLRHKLMVRPDESHDLRLHSAMLKVEPEPNAIYWKHDVFNNSICYLEWSEALRTERHIRELFCSCSIFSKHSIPARLRRFRRGISTNRRRTFSANSIASTNQRTQFCEMLSIAS